MSDKRGLISIIWLIFMMLFFSFSYYHWQVSKNNISPYPISLSEMQVGRIINHHVGRLNELNTRQNQIAAFGYLAAAFTAGFSMCLVSPQIFKKLEKRKELIMANIQIKRSFLVPFVKGVINLSCLISPYQILARFWKHHERIPFWFAEAYVLIRLLVVSLCFLLLDGPTGMVYGALSIVCILMLFDLLTGTAKIFFIEHEERRDPEGHFLVVRDVSRWVILIFLNLGEIVLYFGVLYFRFGDGFELKITDRLTAIYQSLLTFATLGYGEIHPVSPLAKILVMFHLVYFIIFVFLVVPVVFSAIRVKQHTDEQFGEI